MKQMKTATARTLTWLAAVLVVVGCIVMSPSGGFLSLALAALTAFFPAVFAKGKVRIVAAILLIAALALSFGTYPDFRHEQMIYRRQAASHSQKQPQPD